MYIGNSGISTCWANDNARHYCETLPTMMIVTVLQSRRLNMAAFSVCLSSTEIPFGAHTRCSLSYDGIETNHT